MRNPLSNTLFFSTQLLDEVRHNLLCMDLHIVLSPQWVCPPKHTKGPQSSFLFTFLDLEGSTVSAMAQTHLAMFGKAFTFKKWKPRPLLMQCLRCHKFGHLPPRCPLPKDTICCAHCGDNHHTQDHTGKCKSTANHAIPDLCDCPITCINCGQEGHMARDTACPTHDSFKTPAQTVAKSTPPPQ
jgi:hypothetical protein